MRYILGTSTGKSYLIGYGPDQPQRPHHRQSACAATYKGEGVSAAWGAGRFCAFCVFCFMGVLLGSTRLSASCFVYIKDHLMLQADALCPPALPAACTSCCRSSLYPSDPP